MTQDNSQQYNSQQYTSHQYTSHQYTSQRSIPMIRFLIPLALQSLIILAVPAQAIYTHLSGQTVFLKTAPVDPYDPLRGYSVTLGYEVARYEVLKTLPGWKEIPKGGQNWRSGKADPNYPKDDTIVYVTIEPTNSPTSKQVTSRHPAWQPIAVSLKMPNLAPHQAVLRGRLRDGRLESGLETYYMPESRRDEVNNAIRTQPSFLEAKVDREGHATPVKLWVGDRAYEF